jgi:hypothetical protein
MAAHVRTAEEPYRYSSSNYLDFLVVYESCAIPLDDNRKIS